MLLARLEGQNVASASLRIDSLAHYSSRHLAHQFLGAGHKAHIGTAVVQGDTQTLTVTHCDVGTPFGGTLDYCKHGRVAVLHQQGLHRMNQPGKAAVVLDDAVAVHGRYHDSGKVGDAFSHIFSNALADNDIHSGIRSVGLNHIKD